MLNKHCSFVCHRNDSHDICDVNCESDDIMPCECEFAICKACVKKSDNMSCYNCGCHYYIDDYINLYEKEEFKNIIIKKYSDEFKIKYNSAIMFKELKNKNPNLTINVEQYSTNYASNYNTNYLDNNVKLLFPIAFSNYIKKIETIIGHMIAYSNRHESVECLLLDFAVLREFRWKKLSSKTNLSISYCNLLKQVTGKFTYNDVLKDKGRMAFKSRFVGRPIIDKVLTHDITLMAKEISEVILLDYQMEHASRMLEHLTNPNCSVCFDTSPEGSGKTYITLWLIQRLEPERILLIIHKRVQSKWVKLLSDYGIKNVDIYNKTIIREESLDNLSYDLCIVDGYDTFTGGYLLDVPKIIVLASNIDNNAMIKLSTQLTASLSCRFTNVEVIIDRNNQLMGISPDFVKMKQEPVFDNSKKMLKYFQAATNAIEINKDKYNTVRLVKNCTNTVIVYEDKKIKSALLIDEIMQYKTFLLNTYDIITKKINDRFYNAYDDDMTDRLLASCLTLFSSSIDLIVNTANINYYKFVNARKNYHFNDTNLYDIVASSKYISIEDKSMTKGIIKKLRDDDVILYNFIVKSYELLAHRILPLTEDKVVFFIMRRGEDINIMSDYIKKITNKPIIKYTPATKNIKPNCVYITLFGTIGDGIDINDTVGDCPRVVIIFETEPLIKKDSIKKITNCFQKVNNKSNADIHVINLELDDVKNARMKVDGEFDNVIILKKLSDTTVVNYNSGNVDKELCRIWN